MTSITVGDCVRRKASTWVK